MHDSLIRTRVDLKDDKGCEVKRKEWNKLKIVRRVIEIRGGEILSSIWVIKYFSKWPSISTS